jgi:hypothetical protein
MARFVLADRANNYELRIAACTAATGDSVPGNVELRKGRL